MTAPDPTAGEHHPNCYQNTGVPDDLPAGICDCRVLRMLDDASSPAVAASTGTSEDVEALEAALRYAFWNPNNGGNWMRIAADLASGHLAAREAAARAEALREAAEDVRSGAPVGNETYSALHVAQYLDTRARLISRERARDV